MLIPAVLVKDRLQEAWRETCLRDLDRVRFFRVGGGAHWLDDPPNEDWGLIARASVLDGKVLGYCGADVDRDCNVSFGLHAWSTHTGSPTYLRDLLRFCEGLRQQMRFVRFTLAEDSPSRPLAERWAERNGGRVVGTLSAYGRDHNGRLWDGLMFEVPGDGK